MTSSPLAPVPPEVDMIPGDILGRCFLQKAANLPGPLAEETLTRCLSQQYMA